MLDVGTALHVEAVHAEPILVLSGLDEGKTFIGVREIEEDITINPETGGPDPRAKVIIRFRITLAVPNLSTGDVIQTQQDGRRWHATVTKKRDYLTTDFELAEIEINRDTQ